MRRYLLVLLFSLSLWSDPSVIVIFKRKKERKRKTVFLSQTTASRKGQIAGQERGGQVYLVDIY